MSGFLKTILRIIMNIILVLHSLLLFSLPSYGQSSERPETIVIPVATLGNISESRRQIIQNTLNRELTKYFRLVPQDKFEAAQEKAFEQIEYEECTENQCIMLIQEMLQVENVFHLQVIGEGSNTQLSLSWRTLYENKKETDICLECETFEINLKIKNLISSLI